MIDLIPEDVLYELKYEIGRNDLEYVDGYRAYRVKDNYLREEYRKVRDGGCCGEMKIGVTDSIGDKWIVGCNYGH